MSEQESVDQRFRQVGGCPAHERGDLLRVLHEAVFCGFLRCGVAAEVVRERGVHVGLFRHIVPGKQGDEFLACCLPIVRRDRLADLLRIFHAFLVSHLRRRTLPQSRRDHERSHPEDMVDIEVPQDHFQLGDLCRVGCRHLTLSRDGRGQRGADDDEGVDDRSDHPQHALPPFRGR